MSVADAGEYYVNINTLQAREKISLNSIASWPHYKEKDRSRMHNSLLKEAGLLESKKAMTAQDLARIIGV